MGDGGDGGTETSTMISLATSLTVEITRRITTLKLLVSTTTPGLGPAGHTPLS